MEAATIKGAIDAGIATSTVTISEIFGNVLIITAAYLGGLVALGYAIHLVTKYIGRRA